MTENAPPAGLGLSEGLGPLLVGGVTFEPLRLPVPQIARGLPKEVHVFSRSMMEAAVAAERERCAKLCEEVESQAWALWKTTADPIEQGRNIGAQHCADAIRA